MPLISICIPAYKNVDFVKRLLVSVWEQTFKDYEVIISDDSPDNCILEFLYSEKLFTNVIYFKNKFPLGTPENWNHAIKNAKGKWIKIMHDDDWFSSNYALEKFYKATLDLKSDFIFSAYNNIYLDDGARLETITCPLIRFNRVLHFPGNLYAKNVIGPPSVTLIRNYKGLEYDQRMKWLVDIDFYIRLLKDKKAEYIQKPLVNVGMSKVQVTSYTHNKPEIEIPEGLLLLSKLGNKSFNHILYYDAWWRLLRNLGIRGIKSFEKYSAEEEIPYDLHRMIRGQAFIPLQILRIGICSKLLMVCFFLFNKIL